MRTFPLLATLLTVACKPSTKPGALLIGQLSVSETGLAGKPEIGESAEQLRKELALALEGTGRFVVRQDGPVTIRMEIDRAQRIFAPQPMVEAGDAQPAEREMAEVALNIEMTSSGPQGDVDRLLAEGEARRPTNADDTLDPAARHAAFDAALDAALREAVLALRDQIDARSKTDAQLIADLSSQDVRVRDYAIRVLADRRSPAAVPQLIARLQDSNPDVARRAAGALIAVGDRRAVRPPSTRSAAWAGRRRRPSSSRSRAAVPRRRSGAPPRAPMQISCAANGRRPPASPTAFSLRARGSIPLRAGECLEKTRSAAPALRLQDRPRNHAHRGVRRRRDGLLPAGGRQLVDLLLRGRGEARDRPDHRPRRALVPRRPPRPPALRAGRRARLRPLSRYLLHTPLSAGAKWSAVENLVVQRFEVISLDRNLVTQAGTFTRCAVVRNEQPLEKGGKFVTEWTYAPKVGLAQIATSTIDARGRQQEQSKLQLVAYRVQ